MQGIPVFYDARMSVANNQSFSPSAGKPEQVVNDWRAHGMPITLLPVRRAAAGEIEFAHDPAYVKGVLDCQIKNGFGTTSPLIAESLRYTVGSMISAATFVAERKLPVACSPSSGFHHAHWRRASGFCTFNGLVIAAVAAMTECGVKRVGIIDCDYHYGDGTVDILTHPDFKFGRNIKAFTAGATYQDPRHAARLMARLPDALEEMKEMGVSLILYQAGADQHVSDPLGGLLTTRQLQQRDRIVFETCKLLGMPVVWNLAGGYQDPFNKVLTIHRNTMKGCIHVFCQELARS